MSTPSRDRTGHSSNALGLFKPIFFVMCLAVICAVASFDMYWLVNVGPEIQEENPVGQALIRMDNGKVGLFAACKLLGTSAALTVLTLLYFKWREKSIWIAGSVATAMLMLLIYLMC